MSTPEDSSARRAEVDSAIERYLAGERPRDEFEREFVWFHRMLRARELGIDHPQLRAREVSDDLAQPPTHEYGKQEGALGSQAPDAEHRTPQERMRSVVARSRIDATIVHSLGADRAERLERLVDDARLRLARSPGNHDELVAQAKQRTAAAAALNRERSGWVASLEEQRDEHVAWLRAAGEPAIDQSDDAQVILTGHESNRILAATGPILQDPDFVRLRLRAVGVHLRALARDPHHPDRWLERHGRPYAEGHVAQLQLLHERGVGRSPLENIAVEHEPKAIDSPEKLDRADRREPTAQRVRETPDAGLDFF
jgi:hypothetical protein